MELPVLSKTLLKKGFLHDLKKTMLLMRMTAILLLATSLQISARTYSQKVSIRAGDISLEKVLSLIQEQTGYSFLCNRNILDKAEHIRIAVKNVTLTEAMAACLDG